MNQPRWRYSIVVALAFVMLAPTAIIHEEAFAHQEHTDFITNSEYIKGHLEKAVENKQRGNIELAIAHAGHPIEEVFTLMEGPLSEASPQRAADLKDVLEALPNSITSDTTEVVTQKVAAINGLLDEAVGVFAGKETEEVSTKAGVISSLLETAAIEYKEAVVDGQIVEMIEYQDASAFISRANAVFVTVQSEIDAQKFEEILELFEQLESSLQANADPENVETLLDGIIHELSEAVPSSDEHVEFAANLEYIRGHLDQAIANKQAGNNELAIAHAGHTVAEVYALIEGEIEEHDAELNAQLEESLTGLANQINAMTAAQVQTEVSEINALLDQAETTVLGDQMSDPEFSGGVAIAVLETAELEYEEAIANGEIVEMIEYQDSTAFIAQAEEIFTSIMAELPEHEATEIAAFFEQLNSLTASNASFEEVETVIGGIIHEFEEALGLESGEEEELKGWEYIDRIKELLDQSVAEYKEGNVQEAKALAIEAYLENYEFIESDIAEDDRELMEKIELDMRVELVAMIEAGEPTTEVESQVDAIKTDLETARAVVTPEFPLAAMAIAAGMTGFLVSAIRLKVSAFFRGSPV